jgi:hypothetical protein
MNLQEAKELLNTCVRNELRDHAFGDTEVGWTKNGAEVAYGYFGYTAVVSINYINGNHEDYVGDFEGEDAKQLRNYGTTGQISRNDETGPDEYQEGVVMHGLTLEGVREELTGE